MVGGGRLRERDGVQVLLAQYRRRLEEQLKTVPLLSFPLLLSGAHNSQQSPPLQSLRCQADIQGRNEGLFEEENPHTGGYPVLEGTRAKELI
ncbi:hypothetical protein AVEN_50534-1 [Araneus ventricosus]|uniref:Uncharacterized protein n=1 Tax=Araneus ventricosus TaxID=182803 RepID=A0A4Y2ARR5_ARAVE|nr:hypothetical protein AVEN_50534-1 [Araneus ventricosus]